MFSNTITVAIKDLRVLFKDKGALAVLFLLPIVFSVIQGAPQKALGNVGETTPSGESTLVVEAYLVNEDRGPYGQQLFEVLEQVAILDIEKLDSEDEADQMVADGERAAAIIIPAGFSDNVNNHTPSQIQVIADPIQERAASIAAGVVDQAASSIASLGEIQYGIQTVMSRSGLAEKLTPEQLNGFEAQTLGVIWTQMQAIEDNPLITVQSESLKGEEDEGTWNPFSYLMAGFTVMFAFFLMGFIAEKLLQEKEQGSFRRLLSSPMHRGSIIFGKMLAYMVIVVLQVLIMFTVGRTLFEMPLGNSPAALLALTLAMGLASSALGLLIGSLFHNSKQAGNAGTILGFVLMLVGGCVFPTFYQEGLIFYLSQLTPHAHALDGFVQVMNQGAGLITILPNVGILVGMAVLFGTIAMWRLKWE